MAFSFLGPHPLEHQLQRVMDRLAAGDPPSQIELTQIDIKEEPGRRATGGAIAPGAPENEKAARYLAGEMACLANTPGGGAIVLGIADDGMRIGTEIDAEWLRHRLWQLTGGRLTTSVRTGHLDGTRLLILTTHEAIEPIRYEGRLRWRVDANCVDIDPTSWHAERLQRTGVDWSAQPSGHTSEDVSSVAMTIARRYLRAAGDDATEDLATATDDDLLRRLNLLDGEGRLTNAGSLLFVSTPTTGIDYQRRDVPGGDSTSRVTSRRALLEQVWDVDQSSQASNRTLHVPDGFAHGQVRAIPPRALREAIINGIVHRDWLSDQPTVVEHIGDTVTVTSPGGFIGGVAPSNIITHPAVPRYRSLAEAMSALRLAEREGIGVDRMVRDMLANGLPEPEISEIAGPYVRVTLLGGEPDTNMLELLTSIEPPAVSSDVDAVLIIDHLAKRGWIDAPTATPVLQRPPRESEAALQRLAKARVATEPVVITISGVPGDAAPAYRLSNSARARLPRRTKHLQTPTGRVQMIMEWAHDRGRVSSTEVADMTGLSVVRAGQVLTSLEEEGLLDPGRAVKAGRGFFYVPTTTT